MTYCSWCYKMLPENAYKMAIKGRHFCNTNCHAAYKNKTATETVLENQPNKGEVLEREIEILKGDALDMRSTIAKMQRDDCDLYDDIKKAEKRLEERLSFVEQVIDKRVFKNIVTCKRCGKKRQLGEMLYMNCNLNLGAICRTCRDELERKEVPQNKLIDWLHKHPEIDTVSKLMEFLGGNGQRGNLP